jgi:membrane protease YdiL (CAAX protease family)
METFNIDMAWKVRNLHTFLPIILALIGFGTFWFISKSEVIKAKYIAKYDPDQASIKHILMTKYVGLITMGILPLLICLIALPEYGISDYGLYIEPSTSLTSLFWIIGLSFLVVPLVYFSAKKEKNLVNYPQIRAKVWSKNLKARNAVGWAAYLFGYELLFRGVLLFPLFHEFGIWPAIAINIALYSATHIPKGLDETIGAIPLGLVLCILTLLTGTIWIAFILHVIMAWTNTFTAQKFNPAMKSV